MLVSEVVAFGNVSVWGFKYAGFLPLRLGTITAFCLVSRGRPTLRLGALSTGLSFLGLPLRLMTFDLVSAKTTSLGWADTNFNRFMCTMNLDSASASSVILVIS